MNAALLEDISRTCEAGIWYGDAAPEQEAVSTGIPQLDAAAGGIPKGRIVEIYGNEGSGKTALALHMARRLRGPVLYVDADHGLSPHILRNGRRMYLLNVETLEDTLQACQMAIAGGFSAVVVDTVAALPTRQDMDLNINDKYLDGHRENLQAKILSHCLPQFVGPLQATGCTLFLVNQMREKPGVMYGNPEKPTGGNAIKYYAALRLRTQRVETIKRGGDVVGQQVAVNVTKCKYAPPGKRAYLMLRYGEGISNGG